MSFSIAIFIIGTFGLKRRLSWVVTSLTSSLWGSCLRFFMIRTRAASMTWLLSLSTLPSVSRLSSDVSTRFAIVWILIFASSERKDELNENLSSLPMLRDAGSFLRTLYLAHASDCSVRLRFDSGRPVAASRSWTCVESADQLNRSRPPGKRSSVTFASAQGTPAHRVA